MIAGLAGAKRQIQILRARRAKRFVETCERAKHIGPNHHRAASRDTALGPVVLPAVGFPVPYRLRSPEPVLDPASAAVVQPLRVVSEEQLRLRLSEPLISVEGLAHRLDEALAKLKIVVQK